MRLFVARFYYADEVVRERVFMAEGDGTSIYRNGIWDYISKAVPPGYFGAGFDPMFPTELEQKEDLYGAFSDLSKDYYGFRIRLSQEEFDELSVADLEKMVDDMAASLEERNRTEEEEAEIRKREYEAQQKAIKDELATASNSMALAFARAS